MNRLINLSCAIYTVENLNTLAEIKITTLEYRSLVLSNTRDMTTGVENDEISVHSINILKLCFIQYMAGINKINIVIHIDCIIYVGRYLLFIME